MQGTDLQNYAFLCITEKRRREESLERSRRRSASREARSGPREEASEGRRDRGGLDGRSGRPGEDAGGPRRRGEGKPAELRPESRADSYEKPPEDEADPGPSGREEKSRERRRSSRKVRRCGPRMRLHKAFGDYFSDRLCPFQFFRERAGEEAAPQEPGAQS